MRIGPIRRRIVGSSTADVSSGFSIPFGTAWLAAFCAVVAIESHANPSNATGGDHYDIDIHAIAGGGDRAQGGCFELTGTIGQSVVGRASNGEFVLDAGFWPAAARDDAIFLNGFENESCPP